MEPTVGSPKQNVVISTTIPKAMAKASQIQILASLLRSFRSITKMNERAK